MKPFYNVIYDIESVFKVNQAIEIAFSHPDFLEEYESVVESIKDEIISISMPTERSVPENTPCWVYTQFKGQRYGFETMVKDSGSDNQKHIFLKRPGEIMQLHHKRRYFRIPVDILVTFRISRRSKGEPEGVFSGTIRNISTGRVLIVSDAEIPLGSELLLFFNLSDEIDLQDITAKIVRGGIVEKKKKKALYEYGIEFYDIHSEMKRTIMSYILNRQMEIDGENESAPISDLDI
jgi:c-di-GMP-binding flagellar brake protein YcgR